MDLKTIKRILIVAVSFLFTGFFIGCLVMKLLSTDSIVQVILVFLGGTTVGTITAVLFWLYALPLKTDWKNQVKRKEERILYENLSHIYKIVNLDFTYSFISIYLR